MKRSIRSASLFPMIVVLAGCGTMVGSAIDAAARRTGEGIGSAVGQKVGAAAGGAVAARMPAMWTPDMTPIYMNYLFTMAFHSGSYTFEGTDYAPGEWTRWRIVDSESEEPAELERAFLHRTAEGKEWWRVKYVSDTGEGRDSITVEGLFDPETGEFLRMRGKMPGETEAKEMPVEEGTYGYVEPRKLTKESLEGAKVGDETVRVPAGSFQAEHVRYGGMSYGTYDWWLVDSVPGGMVKYSRKYESEDQDGPDPYNWTVELLDSGTNAKSQMGVKF